MTRTCDVLVVGSGAGGLSTAVAAAHAGLSVIVVEKTPWIGGTTAWSGGWLWIPRNPLAQAAGIDEPIDGPLQYLQSEMGNRCEDPRIRAFLDAGPAMVAFFRDHSAIEWIAGNTIADFHDSPGALAGGRSVSVAPYDARHLGDWADRLRPPLDVATIGGMGIAAGADLKRFFDWHRSAGNAAYVARRLGRHGIDRLRHGRATQLVAGNALAARLLRSALDKGVTLLTGTPVLELAATDGRIIGARVADGDIVARRGVVLATGGFPHDGTRIAMRFEQTEHYSAAPPENTGDGLRLAEAIGAHLPDDLVHPAAWAPVSRVPRRDGSVANFPHLVDRAKPGIIAVGPDGRRFTNEADSYHDFMGALFRTWPAQPHAWIIADARARRRFGLGAAKPFPFPERHHLASGYLVRAQSPRALAVAIGVDADVLDATLSRFNAAAHRGEDPDFRRGESPYNRMQGDNGVTLGALERAPFYAVKVQAGSLGTFAGIATDAHARVLDEDDRPMPGLYAVGNDASSIFGGHYPSGGITLGPAMTFGYIAGCHLAGTTPTSLD